MVFEVANEVTCASAMLHEDMPALSVILRHRCVLLRTQLLANTNTRLAGHVHAMPNVADHSRSGTHVGETIRTRGSMEVRISACHADDPGAIPGRGLLA